MPGLRRYKASGPNPVDVDGEQEGGREPAAQAA
jgi:hypothetical protein